MNVKVPWMRVKGAVKHGTIHSLFMTNSVERVSDAGLQMSEISLSITSGLISIVGEKIIFLLAHLCPSVSGNVISTCHQKREHSNSTLL